MTEIEENEQGEPEDEEVSVPLSRLVDIVKEKKTGSSGRKQNGVLHMFAVPCKDKDNASDV